MKTKHLFLIILLLGVGKIVAQTYYYNTSQIFTENGYSYRCNTTIGGDVTLCNANNIYTDSLTFNYKDGTRVTNTNILWGYVPLTEKDNWTKQTCMSIVNNAFSATEKQRVLGEKFDINMTINSDNGHVIEVDFRFLKNSPFATIPISTYRTIEQNLKNQIWFTPTEVGSQLLVLVCGWMHKVE
ncbi:MAG: DUF5043 domain-containing protein [Dysgonamonadaceae bacterium]|jgi:hypothetical protein|nr:DUF5043 domain-containing protein [Dysgonamonadaceae bacterium]